MGRKFQRMQTEEQRYAATTRTPAPTRPATPASNEVWSSMTAYEQAAHLARLDGKEDEARKWERLEKGPSTAPRKRRWLF